MEMYVDSLFHSLSMQKSLTDLSKIDRINSYFSKIFEKNEVLEQESELKDDANMETIATMKESCLINIITDCTNETIALRRTIGTDAADMEFVTFEQEIVSASLSNMLKMDSFSHIPCCETKDAPKFIHDLSQPSTSKGVRQVSMNVQCGPDDYDDYLIINKTSTFTNLSKDLNTALNIYNPEYDAEQSSNKNNCGTCIGENESYLKTIIPRVRSTGITIKDSGTSIKDKMIYDTQRSEQSLALVPPTANSSSKKVDIIPTNFQNASNLQTDLSLCKNYKDDNSMCTDYNRLNLCRGVIYIHSYKDTYINEDVVYQGEWQKYIPNHNIGKKVISPHQALAPLHRTQTVPVNRKIMSRPKENIDSNMVNKVLQKKRFPNNDIANFVSKIDDMKATKNIPLHKSIKCNREIKPKCLSKLIIPKRNMKMVFVSDQHSKTLKTVTKCYKKDPNSDKKNYLPLYLKRRLLEPNINHINNLISNDKKIINNDSILNKKNTLYLKNINIEHRKKISYVVFRNEIETKQNCSTDSESPKSKVVPERADEVVKINNVESLNSSASPSAKNTIVKVPSTKITRKRNVSGISNRANCTKNVAEDTERTVKKYKNTDKVLKNNDKENIIAASNKHKTIEPTTNSYATKQNIFRAHISTENLQNHINVYRQTSQTLIRTIVRRPSSSNINEKYTISNDFLCPIGIKYLEPISTPLEIQATTSVDATSTKTPDCNTTASINGRENLPLVSMENENCSQECINIKTIKGNEGAKTFSVQSSDSDCLQKQSNASEHVPPTLNMSMNEQPIYPSKNSIRNVSPCMKQNLHKINASLKTESIATDSSGVVASSKIQNKKLGKENNMVDIVDNNDFDDKQDKICFLRHLIEERLDFIRISNNDTAAESDSETVYLNNEKPKEAFTNFNDTHTNVINDTNSKRGDSFLEIKDDFCAVGNDLTSNLSGTQQTVTDLEMLSFKSVTSVSKLSEYFLAESSIGNLSNFDDRDYKTECSIQDIFERKTLLSSQSPDGAAYSGFSMNTAQFNGNQLDLVNLIDSETGSIAREFIRQTASEEVLVSVRSSDSYETCVIDDDSVVPNWLFHIISQQTSEEVENEDGENNYEEPDNIVPMQLPISEPIFDGNGNMVEPGIGAAAGAGDGRGIHSDISQDSSGNGTSLSSTDTSSPQSVAVIIDPTAFTTQYEFIRTSSSASAHVSNFRTSSEYAVSSRAAQDTAMIQDVDLLHSSGDPQCLPRGASDIDADVSSTDTDVPDYSDNLKKRRQSIST